MQFEYIAQLLQKTPGMMQPQGRIIYDFITGNSIFKCLELGFSNGTSSCYIAAALHEKDVGHLKTIDLTRAKSRTPNIYDLLKKSGLERYVEPVFANTSYTWELMKIIDEQTRDGLCKPLYDFCFIDRGLGG